MGKQQVTDNYTAGSHSTEVLLEAVTVCITHILNADSLRAALPDALQAIARVVRIDCMVVVENIPDGEKKLKPNVYFVWRPGTLSRQGRRMRSVSLSFSGA